MNFYRCTAGATQMLVTADTTSEAMLKFVVATGAQPRDTHIVML